MLVLFAILVIGTLIGQITIKGIKLGAAGVLFTAMVFGHLGYTIPTAIMELGLLLFVYAVGLQAGPRFFRTFQRHGIQYVVIALVIVGVGALVTVAVGKYLGLDYQLASGLYTGALTCTPALAGAIAAVERIAPGSSGSVSVGYGIAYPFSLISVVLIIQFLPRLARRNLRKEEAHWAEEKQMESPALEARVYRITNPNCDGKQIREINPHRMTLANISRVKRNGQVFAASPETMLQVGDVVMVVGAADELAKMPLLLGDETDEPMDVNANVLSVDVEVVEASLAGKKLAQLKVWERYTVLITRIRRQGLEITPTGNVSLEMGDNIRVVGEKNAVDAFAKLVQGSPRRASETNMLPFLAGLLLGILLGSIPVNLPNGITVRLGMAGGAFIVSLLVGHFGGLGPLRLYVPPAAKNVLRELGLIFFLAGAGITAGANFLEILQGQGLGLLLGGALITILSILAGLALMFGLYRMNLLAVMGSLSASMTNPVGLEAANAQTEAELPVLSYASIYPVALIFKIVLAQILVEVLRQIL
jgi:putative transport protein